MRIIVQTTLLHIEFAADQLSVDLDAERFILYGFIRTDQLDNLIS